ncbi:TetR/AcrR family transcriptional regulator [Amycolatopsis thermoflava]|uniref:TetR/AcrR family transcriptional regulator n=1 Tax=Amycolatopsis thermoflava TaxID=84480 RepID=UPI003D749813
MENELYEQAARLFAQKGLAGTSFQDIASAMGVSRQALYRYARNKDDILAKLVREMIAVTTTLSERFRDDSVPADTRLRAVVHDLAFEVARHPFRHRLIAQSESVLTGRLADEHTAQRRRFVSDTVALIETGQAAGVFRAVDAHAAALSVLGLANWVAWWFHGDTTSAAHAAELVADMAVRGLCTPQRLAGEATGPRAALELIKDGVRTLEMALDHPTALQSPSLAERLT